MSPAALQRLRMLAALLRQFSWGAARQQPWATAAAVLAVALGVALALSVQLINASALSEFAGAVRSVNGQPDVQIKARNGRLDEAWFARIATDPAVQAANPVIEVTLQAQRPAAPGGASVLPPASTGTPARLALRLVAHDGLLAFGLAPERAAQAFAGADRLSLFAPRTVFLNPSALQALRPPDAADDAPFDLTVWIGLQPVPLRVAGRISAGGPALAAMDIGAAQDLLGMAGTLSRIDVRWLPGADVDAAIQRWSLPSSVLLAQPGDDTQRVSNLSRAYRVNLTVLALVALFTGAFLVFSMLSLSVTRRLPQWALLGVLGLGARERQTLVVAESALLGVLGSALGVGLGTGLAAVALYVLGGDLGGGYFGNASPPLQWSALAALAFGALGVGAAVLGGWWPARAAAQLSPAAGLKGLGWADRTQGSAARRALVAPLGLLALGGVLSLAPPIAGLPLAAYGAIGCGLVGGIALLPALVAQLRGRALPWAQRHALVQLGVERARRVPGAAAVALSGVVAALSLAVALTVMVASFRSSVERWLDAVLPADVYLRTGSASGGAADIATLPPELVQALGQLPGVRASATVRHINVQLDASRPPIALVARDFAVGLAGSADLPAHERAAQALPLVSPPLVAPPGMVPVYVSEAMVDLHGAQLGQSLPALAVALALAPKRSGDAAEKTPGAPYLSAEAATFFVAGVWRDYARQFGTVAIERSQWVRLTGDTRVNDMALWLAPGATAAGVQDAARAAAAQFAPQAAQALEWALAGEIRAVSLQIFDRSFAVTYWLQVVAIGIGLFGVAAGFSAQMLARRKEFGLLAHLGLTRSQVTGLVALEGLIWSAVGAAAGLTLGLAVSAILVHVVNPQSFHWTMDLTLPKMQLALLAAGVVAAGTATTAWVGRRAAAAPAVMAVREDW